MVDHSIEKKGKTAAREVGLGEEYSRLEKAETNDKSIRKKRIVYGRERARKSTKRQI